MATKDPASARLSLVDRLAEELGRRWHAGECPVVEDYLALYPELGDDAEAAAELIYEELCLREELGQKEAAADVLERFPQWQEQLRLLIQCHNFLEPPPALTSFPSPGEKLGDFHLLAELGRGGHGRVFLATETALADRPVVLKLAPRSGHEHLSLARLQHTHIVPLYSVEDDPARGLRALCMPYFGGATLAHLLEALHGQSPDRRTGRHILEALRAAKAAARISVPVEGPACQFLAQVSYTRAACWLGVCLAEALQYTHERGLLHLDLKPSNVLWAADGQPMLLDLHLAREPLVAGAPGPVWLGGTPAYMAPEQRLAMEAVTEGRNIPVALDGRTDLYALGALLVEVLGGALPPVDQELAPWLRQRNPQVSVGLSDVLGKCLARAPEDRFRDAAALADALRCQLTDRPLRGARNQSVAKRSLQWRRPYWRLLIGVTLAMAALLGLAAAYVGHEAHKAREALAEASALLHHGDTAAAREALQRGLATAAGLPFHGGLSQELREQLRVAERAAAAQALHVLIERLRAIYGADHPATSAAHADVAHADALGVLEAHCREFWRSREMIVKRLDTPAGPERDGIQTDLLDLAILWTHLHVRQAGKDESQGARQVAIEILAQAQALFGSSCVLDMEIRTHATALGVAGPEAKAGQVPRTAWEYFAVGRAHYQNGHIDEAAADFERALALQPQDFWSHFFKGKCAYQRGRYEDTILAFTACIVLAPGKAWCHYNRGLAYEALGQAGRALVDYNRALQLEPKLALAAVNRGMLYYRAKRYADALDDLHLARKSGAEGSLVHYNLALIHLDQGERNAALTNLLQALRFDPAHAQARDLLKSLESKK